MRPLLTLALLIGPLCAAAGLTPVDETAYQKLIAANKGKILIVDFWATWCEPCRKEMPDLAKLASRWKAKGVELVSISADEPENQAAANAFLLKSGVSGQGYLRRVKDEDKFINSIDPKWSGALPAMFLYDRGGRKVKSFVGETPLKDVEAALAKLN